MNGKENLELVVENIEDRIRQFRDALGLLNESDHLQAMYSLRYVIEKCFEPSLKSAREKLKGIKWD